MFIYTAVLMNIPPVPPLRLSRGVRDGYSDGLLIGMVSGPPWGCSPDITPDSSRARTWRCTMFAKLVAGTVGLMAGFTVLYCAVSAWGVVNGAVIHSSPYTQPIIDFFVEVLRAVA